MSVGDNTMMTSDDLLAVESDSLSWIPIWLKEEQYLIVCFEGTISQLTQPVYDGLCVVFAFDVFFLQAAEGICLVLKLKWIGRCNSWWWDHIVAEARRRHWQAVVVLVSWCWHFKPLHSHLQVLNCAGWLWSIWFSVFVCCVIVAWFKIIAWRTTAEWSCIERGAICWALVYLCLSLLSIWVEETNKWCRWWCSSRVVQHCRWMKDPAFSSLVLVCAEMAGVNNIMW